MSYRQVATVDDTPERLYPVLQLPDLRVLLLQGPIHGCLDNLLAKLFLHLKK